MVVGIVLILIGLKAILRTFVPPFPEQNQQATENHAAKVSKMSHYIAAEIGYAGKEFKSGVDAYEDACRNRNRDEKQKHSLLREEPGKGQKDAEDCARRAYRDGRSAMSRKVPDQLLNQCRARAAHDIVYKVSLRTPLAFYYRPKHPHGQHVAKQMREIGVHQHVREGLPQVEGTAYAAAIRHDAVVPKRKGTPIPIDQTQKVAHVVTHFPYQ